MEQPTIHHESSPLQGLEQSLRARFGFGYQTFFNRRSILISHIDALATELTKTNLSPEETSRLHEKRQTYIEQLHALVLASPSSTEPSFLEQEATLLAQGTLKDAGAKEDAVRTSRILAEYSPPAN